MEAYPNNERDDHIEEPAASGGDSNESLRAANDGPFITPDEAGEGDSSYALPEDTLGTADLVGRAEEETLLSAELRDLASTIDALSYTGGVREVDESRSIDLLRVTDYSQRDDDIGEHYRITQYQRNPGGAPEVQMEYSVQADPFTGELRIKKMPPSNPTVVHDPLADEEFRRVAQEASDHFLGNGFRYAHVAWEEELGLHDASADEVRELTALIRQVYGLAE